MWCSSNQRKDEIENPNHQLSDLGKQVKRMNFATQAKLEEKLDFLLQKMDGEKKSNNMSNQVKYIDIESFKQQISAMISIQMEEDLNLFLKGHFHIISKLVLK